MRVAAFWAAIAGLAFIAARVGVLAVDAGMDAASVPPEAVAAVGLVASVAQIVFYALLVVVLFVMAFTGRKYPVERGLASAGASADE